MQPARALAQPCLQPPAPEGTASPAPSYLGSDWTSLGFQLRFPGVSSLPQLRRPPVTCPGSAARGAGLAWPRLGAGGGGALTGKGRANDVRQMKSAGRGGGRGQGGRRVASERLGPSPGWGVGGWQQERGTPRRSSPRDEPRREEGVRVLPRPVSRQRAEHQAPWD